ENGRNALVDISRSQQPADLLPLQFNARTRVHEYGGTCTTSDNQGNIFFTNFSDQRIYSISDNGVPSPITPAEPLRFACLEFDHLRNSLFAVMEDHRASDLEPVNSIVRIDVKSGQIQTICEGHDFFASIRLSPDGKTLAATCWDHPDMPWDQTKLLIIDLAPNGNAYQTRVLPGRNSASIMQPEWLGEKLFFLSDENGFWNLFCLENGTTRCLLEKPADFGKPMWSIGTTNYAVIDADRIFLTWCEKAEWQAGIYSLSSGSLSRIELPYNNFASITTDQSNIYFIGSSFSILPEIVKLDPNGCKTEILFTSPPVPIAPEFISIPQSIEFQAAPDEMVQAFYYPPCNPNYPGSFDAPPLLVVSHGGPTTAARLVLDLSTQFWTTRGFAVVDVNYSGSSGFGREYRQRLNHNWGIKDVRDCEKAAEHLIGQKLADPARTAIRGGSAGGFTTLCALVFTDTFKAGASHFGLSDLEILARETHKFESRYMDRLIGDYQNSAEIYRERSPINHLEKLSCPVIFFQGLDDKVVPPNQAELMYNAICQKGLPAAYVAYEGEGHGFRKAENIKHSLESELYFFQKVFSLPLEAQIAPMNIANLTGD
ncbi:MAG: S9 family peptidase, partial [Candidatus Riflebacteria bacterium]